MYVYFSFNIQRPMKLLLLLFPKLYKDFQLIKGSQFFATYVTISPHIKKTYCQT